MTMITDSSTASSAATVRLAALEDPATTTVAGVVTVTVDGTPAALSALCTAVGLLSAAAMPLVAPAVAARTVMVTWAVTTKGVHAAAVSGRRKR